MKETIREEVLDFAMDMEDRLLENDHKSGWKNMPLDELYRDMMEEVFELYLALHYFHLARPEVPDALPNTASAVIREAADVANFCMMIADNVGQGLDRG